MDNLTLKDFIAYGGQAFQTAIIWLLWKRLTDVTDRLFKYLDQAALERKVLAQTAGLDTQQMQSETDKLRRQSRNN